MPRKSPQIAASSKPSTASGKDGKRRQTTARNERHYFHQYSKASNIIAFMEQQAASPHLMPALPMQTSPGKFQALSASVDWAPDPAPAPFLATVTTSNKLFKQRLQSSALAPTLASTFPASSVLSAVETNLLSTHHLPDFVLLQQSSLEQLQTVAQRILSADTDCRNQQKPIFLHAILAARNASLKLVATYQRLHEDQSGPSYENWDSFVEHVAATASSLNFLDTEPFLRLSGLHFSYNPFAGVYDLFQELSISAPLPDAMLQNLPPAPQYDARLFNVLPRELHITEKQLAQHVALGQCLRVLCETQAASSNRATSRSGSQEAGAGELRASKQSALQFLLFNPAQQHVLQSRGDLAMERTRRYTLARSWRTWCVHFAVRRTGLYFTLLQREKRLRRAWNAICVHYEHVRSIRSLLQSRDRQWMARAWRSWQAVVNWWRVYDAHVQKRQRRVVRHYLRAWRETMATGGHLLLDLQEHAYSFSLQCRPGRARIKRWGWGTMGTRLYQGRGQRAWGWKSVSGVLFYPRTALAAKASRAEAEKLVTRQVWRRWHRIWKLSTAWARAMEVFRLYGLACTWRRWAMEAAREPAPLAVTVKPSSAQGGSVLQLAKDLVASLFQPFLTKPAAKLHPFEGYGKGAERKTEVGAEESLAEDGEEVDSDSELGSNDSSSGGGL